MLRYWDSPVMVKSPDGRAYVVRVVAAGITALPDPRGLIIGGPWHLICLTLGRAWRVEVSEAGRQPKSKGWRPTPHIAVMAETSQKRRATAEARKAADVIATRGWQEGVTHRYL